MGLIKNMFRGLNPTTNQFSNMVLAKIMNHMRMVIEFTGKVLADSFRIQVLFISKILFT